MRPCASAKSSDRNAAAISAASRVRSIRLSTARSGGTGTFRRSMGRRRSSMPSVPRLNSRAESISGGSGEIRTIRGQHRRVLQQRSSSLRVEHDEVVRRLETIEQILKPRAPIGRVQQQVRQLSGRIVGDDEIEIRDHRRGDDVPGRHPTPASETTRRPPPNGSRNSSTASAVRRRRRGARESPQSARKPPRFAATVVFPTPPLVLTM